MKEELRILIIIGIWNCISSIEFSDWRDYPTCRLGRLQSPIEIKETESKYSNDFSFVYQNYKQVNNIKIEGNATNFALTSGEINGGYINFERGGVIKQYELIRIDVYNGLHKIDGQKSDYELHLVHKKNLDFNTNKNQYRSIQDANMYLTVVLRYNKKDNCDKNICASDAGLLKTLNVFNDVTNFNLNSYSIFQEKRAFLYEGASLHIPCDENVNYYIVNDIFIYDGNFDAIKDNKIDISKTYDRPIYKNFMNYKEVMKSNIISVKMFSLLLLIYILL